MSVIRCPVCGKPVDPAASPRMPFCSQRCSQIDLKRWLNEEYGMPYEPEEKPEWGENTDDQGT